MTFVFPAENIVTERSNVQKPWRSQHMLLGRRGRKVQRPILKIQIAATGIRRRLDSGHGWWRKDHAGGKHGSIGAHRSIRLR